MEIASIRILPNSKSTFPTESDFKVFVEKTMIDRGGYYYFPGVMMKCPDQSLILFQYDGKIRAYGILIDKSKETVFDEQGVAYGGYYKFDNKSLHYLDNPIDKEILIKAYPEFKGFSQAKQAIPIEYLDKIKTIIEQ